MRNSRARLQADFANQAKSAFLADLSGEIESPIRAILGDALILRSKQNMNETQRQAVDSIVLNGENLSAIICGIVEISLIEAGSVEFAPGNFDLGELINGLNKTPEITIVPLAEAGGMVNGDARLLREALQTMLNNAVEEGEGAAVNFSVSRQGEDDYAFAIVGGGLGFASDEMAHIFEPFYKPQGATSKSAAGHNLAIADKKNSDDGQ